MLHPVACWICWGNLSLKRQTFASVYLKFLGGNLLPENSQALLQLWGATVACASQQNCIILNVRWKWVLLKQEKKILDQGPARSAHTLAGIYVCSAFWLLPCTPGSCLAGFILKEARKKSRTGRVMERCEEPAGPKRLILSTESKKSCLGLPGAVRLACVQDWPLP